MRGSEGGRLNSPMLLRDEASPVGVSLFQQPPCQPTVAVLRRWMEVPWGWWIHSCGFLWKSDGNWRVEVSEHNRWRKSKTCSIKWSNTFYYFLKIQVCWGKAWLEVIGWNVNHGFNSHQVRIAFVAVQMLMTTNRATTLWWMVSLVWSSAKLSVPTLWPGCKGLGHHGFWICEMVIFEPAELSIGCHHLIEEIERAKSGDSVSVYPTGCISLQVLSWI